MSRAMHILLAILAIPVLTACGESEPVAETGPVSRPVKTIVVGEGETGFIRNFPGRVEAANRADLAFRVSGKLVEISVNEGDQVKAGQVLARLDDTDFKIRLADRQASFDVASANYERGKKLVDSGTISRVDFDRLEANFKNASASLELAQQDLTYTELKAAFDGSVGRRLVDNFEEIQAKQPVISLRSVDSLEVKIDVPESLVVQLQRRAPAQRQENRVPVFATFDAAPGKQFDLEFKEVAVQADAQTQTFEVTFMMVGSEALNILPGMTTTVTADFSGEIKGEQAFYLPVSAVIADTQLNGRVFVVDESSMTVQARAVEVGTMRGNEIAVTAGLNGGDRVVIAGVPFLVEGMPVTLFPTIEQAAPRPGDAGPES